jgi:sporulation integral membrane protein YlbJ
MESLFFILMFIIIVLIYILLKDKNIIIIIFCSLLILQMILTPSLCIDGAIFGAQLFFYKVFPSLFPFLIISNIMLAYNGVHFYSKLLGPLLCAPLKLPNECSFVLIISALCGYPLGAKYACDLYERHDIDIETCQRLINIASNPSPLFIIGAVGTSMLQNTKFGYILLFSCYISCFLMGLIIRKPNKLHIKKITVPNLKNVNIGQILKESVDDAIKTSLSVGGFVVIFSVLNYIIKSNIVFNITFTNLAAIFSISISYLQGVFLGIIEMTNGCYFISSAQIGNIIKISTIGFMLSFSGLSVISQVYSFTYKYNLSFKTYIFRKFIQGLITSLISITLFFLIP